MDVLSTVLKTVKLEGTMYRGSEPTLEGELTPQLLRKAVESLLEVRRGGATEPTAQDVPEVNAEPPTPPRTLKRYADD